MRSVAFLAGAFLVLAGSHPARALTIQASFDSSIVAAPNAADIENTINFATNEISSLFSNPGTVTILFKYSSGSFLGESNSSFYFDTYATVTSELQANLSANPQNTVLATALSNLSSGNDANGSRDIEATSAEFRLALGDNTATPCFDSTGTFVNGCNAVYDGVITLSSSQPIDFTRPVPSYDGTNLQYDGVRVAEHEIDEVLGGGGSGTMLGSPDQSRDYGVLDLYRYSAPGVPRYTGSGLATSYFSIDGGNTNIVGFNQSRTGDYGDWGPNNTLCAGGGSGGPGFVQDAFSCNNVQADVTSSSPEFTMLAAIGYDPASVSSNVSWDCSTNPDSANHSGAIGAIKTTACTQIVLGDNTYTRGTVIAAGTLQIGNGGTAGSITGDVTDNGVFAINSANNFVFDGVISGSGALTKSGSGYMYLTAADTYSGGTTISGGALLLGNGGTMGSIAGNVVDNGLFYINRADQYTFGGVISGTGEFVQAGTGTTILAADNTYTGGTIIEGGTLQVGTGAIVGSITGNVIDDGVFAVNSANNFLFNGVISGSGSFVKSGSGYMFLTAAETYSGGTTVSGGALLLGSGGTTGSIVGDVTDNSLFYIDRADQYTFGGTISGTGEFVQGGNGTTILTATNTYTGGTIIEGGTLQIGNGGTAGSITGNVIDDGVFAVNSANNFVFDGVISGTGAFVKSGSGYMYLTAADTYSGGTTISGGALLLGNGGTTGSIAGNVVDNGLFYINRADQYTFGGVISGAGELVQAGNGTTILTATNTFTGGTIIEGGTLQIGNGGTAGSITGYVIDDGVFAVNRANNVLFGGVISGTGEFVQAGTGTTTLTATNTYTGGTIVSGGTLQIGNGGAAGSITGDVTDNGVFAINSANNFRFNGVISGSGSFIKSGSGYMFLTGPDTYSGGTTISGGALLLGGGGTTGSIVGDVTDNSLFYIDRADQYTFGGTISGTGEFVQAGNGTTILTATNTYTGGTIIEGGTLQPNTSGALGTGSVTFLVPSSTLQLSNGVNLSNTIKIQTSSFIDVNGTDTATISGALVGSAPFEKDGTGTLILDHDNRPTYSGNISYHGTLIAGTTGAFGTGTVTVLGSTLVLNDGVTITSPITLADDLTVAQNGGSATISGVIAQAGGPWGLDKIGAGTLFLDSVGTYSGATLVDGGDLDVNGTIASSSVHVRNGTLKGNGTIGGLIVDSGATVAPGNSIGTITVAGNVAFAADSVYQVEVTDAGQSDEIVATGSATLNGGNVQLAATPGKYAPVSVYPILTAAGGVMGTFANVSSNIVILSPSISYKSNEVDLVLRFSPLASFAATSNQANVAAAIQGNFTGALFNAVDTLAPGKLTAAFDATSGEIHASVHSILLEEGQTLRQSVLDRLHDAQLGDKPAAWGRLFGTWGAIGTDGNAAAVDTNFSGLSGGVDVPLGDGLRTGFVGGYGTVAGFAGARGSSVSGDTAHLGLYGEYLDGPFSLKSGLIGTWGTVKIERVVRLSGLSDLDTARQVVRSNQAFVEAAYDADLDGVSFEPFANGGWIDAITGGFTEHGGAAALTGEHASTSEPFSTLGLRLETVLTAPEAIDFHPYASLGWLHAYSDLTPSRTLSFVATGSSFTVFGVPLDRDQAVIEVGVTAHPVPGITANLGYQGVLSDRAHDNALRANLAWEF